MMNAMPALSLIKEEHNQGFIALNGQVKPETKDWLISLKEKHQLKSVNQALRFVLAQAQAAD